MTYNVQNRTLEDRQILKAAQRVPSFEEALARLLYVVEHRRPCGLLVGLAGTGKSVLLESVFRELTGSGDPRTICEPLKLNLRATGTTELAWTLAAAMGLSPGDQTQQDHLWRLITDRFQGAAMSGQSIVPLIDHWEQNDEKALISLSRCCRLAVEYNSTVLLSIRPRSNSSLAEVVGPLCDLRVELPLWTREETMEFVTDILSPQQPRIDEGAIDAIHACCGGRMRDTVQVLRLSVFAAQAQGLDTIDADLVQTVAGEIWQPVPPVRTGQSFMPSTTAMMTATD